MPPDLPNEQELMLKKRARRRLVGAIALVLLMVIVLPQILQDRAAMTQHEPIKITMPDIAAGSSEQVVADKDIVGPEAVRQASTPAVPVADNVRQDENVKPVENVAAKQASAGEKAETVPSAVRTEKKPAVKAAVKEEPKQHEAYTVQVGVYSDLANVKRIQEQLKQAGFSTYTEKIKTPKGDSVRLKAGNFTSRQDAVSALAKLREIGLPGIVVGNE